MTKKVAKRSTYRIQCKVSSLNNLYSFLTFAMPFIEYDKCPVKLLPTPTKVIPMSFPPYIRCKGFKKGFEMYTSLVGAIFIRECVYQDLAGI